MQVVTADGRTALLSQAGVADQLLRYAFFILLFLNLPLTKTRMEVKDL